jgi:hypothetical protein
VNERGAKLAFVLAAGAITLATLFLSVLGMWRDAPRACLVAFACAGLAWLVAVATAERARIALPVVCGVALLLRVLALGSSLELSDDVYRYVWEGELSARGISPYAFAPGDPALDGVRAELPTLAARVAHAEVPAVYPPVVQGSATLAVRIAHALGLSSEFGAPRVLRFLLAGVDLLVLWPLAALARRHGRGAGVLVAWAFCPLVVFEFAGSAHFDVVGIALLLVALLALARADERTSPGREVGAGALVAAAIASKYLPIFTLPWLGKGRRGIVRGVLAAVFLALAFAPFLFLFGGERGFLGGLHQYRDRWEAGCLVFRFVRDGVRTLLGAGVDVERVARILVALVWCAWAVLVRVRVADRVHGVGLLLAGFLVLTPTLHPWYLIWVLPFVALRPSRAWLWIFAAAPILYAPLAGWQEQGSWIEPAWLWPVFALPFFALLLADHRRFPRASPQS